MHQTFIRRSSSPSGAVRPEADWLASSPAEPCPVCGASERCHRHSQHEFASCVHTVSEWPMTTGAWLHPLAPATVSRLGALVGPREPA